MNSLDVQPWEKHIPSLSLGFLIVPEEVMISPHHVAVSAEGDRSVECSSGALAWIPFLSEYLLSTYEPVTVIAALEILENKAKAWGVSALMMLTF